MILLFRYDPAAAIPMKWGAVYMAVFMGFWGLGKHCLTVNITVVITVVISVVITHVITGQWYSWASGVLIYRVFFFTGPT